MSKEMYISSSPHETKVAVLEDDQLVEVYFERDTDVGLVGGIYKGRVSRVLPGMQSAFVDIGLERDAFLYVSDFFYEDQEEYDKVFEEAEARATKFTDAAGRSSRRRQQRRLLPSRWNRAHPLPWPKLLRLPPLCRLRRAATCADACRDGCAAYSGGCTPSPQRIARAPGLRSAAWPPPTASRPARVRRESPRRPQVPAADSCTKSRPRNPTRLKFCRASPWRSIGMSPSPPIEETETETQQDTLEIGYGATRGRGTRGPRHSVR